MARSGDTPTGLNTYTRPRPVRPVPAPAPVAAAGTPPRGDDLPGVPGSNTPAPTPSPVPTPTTTPTPTPTTSTNPRAGDHEPPAPAPTPAPGTTPQPQVPGAPVYEDASVDKQLSGILNQNSPLMQQAQTAGLSYANKRGLGNSSLAAQASQNAVISAATPIASQNAAQISQRNLAAQGIFSNEKIAGMNVASNDREKADAAVAALESNYTQQFNSIMNNTAIPAAQRQKYLDHLMALRSSTYSLIEQLYGIDLTWATPAVAA